MSHKGLIKIFAGILSNDGYKFNALVSVDTATSVPTPKP
jgi:hypothetical protein